MGCWVDGSILHPDPRPEPGSKANAATSLGTTRACETAPTRPRRCFSEIMDVGKRRVSNEAETTTMRCGGVADVSDGVDEVG